jgi:hypothetical protein
MKLQIANDEHEIRKTEHGAALVLMAKPAQRIDSASVVREATTGRVVFTVPGVVVRPRPMLLPKVWAVAEAPGNVPAETPTGPLGATQLLLLRARDKTSDDVLNANPDDGAVVAPHHGDGTGLNSNHEDGSIVNGALRSEETLEEGAAADGTAFAETKVELAFYRRYTEAMVRRYLRLSMAAGRVPSLLGRELFRGHVTSYKVQSFEDVVIFCFDMEKLLGRLRPMDQQMIKRIVLQEYTQVETASMLRISLRSCERGYREATDRLTGMLLEAGMLETVKSCQGGPHLSPTVSSSLQVV